jgi:hypothetical protein
MLLTLAGYVQARLIAYYPFDGDFSDALGDPQKVFTPINDPNFAPGHRGLSAQFDGIDQTAVTTSFVIDDFSIVFWVCTLDSQPEGNRKFWNGKGLVSTEFLGCEEEAGDWGISLQNIDKVSFGIGGFCDDTHDVQSETAINDGQWHFICCTRNGTTGEYKIYVDEGQAQDSHELFPVYPRQPLPMYLASINSEPGKFLNDRIDELAFFDHVLAQNEIDLIRIHGIQVPARAMRIAPTENVAVPYQTLLQWTHPGIVESYRLYLDTDPLRVADPNLPWQTLLIAGEQIQPASPSDPNAFFLFDQVQIGTDYYWRVDSLVVEPNWACTLPDSNDPCWNIYTWTKGEVWRFSGMSQYIAFTGSFEDQYILPDPAAHQMPAGLEIKFSAQVIAVRPIIQYQWLMDNVPVFIDNLNFSEEIAAASDYQIDSVLTVHNAARKHQGRYQFKVMLDTLEEFTSPPASLYVSSEIIKHRYSFTGNLEDSISDANGILIDPGAPNITFDGGQIVFDAGEDDNGSNNLSGDPNAHFIDLPDGLISALGNNMTIMVWFTWEDPAERANQRIFDFGIGDEELEAQPAGSENGDFLTLTPKNDSQSNPKLQFAARFDGFTEILSADPPAVGQPTCAAITWCSTDKKMRLYIDGLPADEADLNGKLSDLDDRGNWLGRSRQAQDPLYVGRFDELRIYNIPLSGAWIKALYDKGPDNDPLSADPCLLHNALDLNGDCVVDIADFAVFAENWLWCGLLSCQE